MHRNGSVELGPENLTGNFYSLSLQSTCEHMLFLSDIWKLVLDGLHKILPGDFLAFWWEPQNSLGTQPYEWTEAIVNTVHT